MWKERSIARAINRLCFSQRRLCTKTEKEEFVALFQKRERPQLSHTPHEGGPGPDTICCQRDASEQDQQDSLTSLAEATRAADSSTPRQATVLGVKGTGCPAWEVDALSPRSREEVATGMRASPTSTQNAPDVCGQMDG